MHTMRNDGLCNDLTLDHVGARRIDNVMWPGLTVAYRRAGWRWSWRDESEWRLGKSGRTIAYNQKSFFFFI